MDYQLGTSFLTKSLNLLLGYISFVTDFVNHELLARKPGDFSQLLA
jgi:hypothetical protein